MKSSTKDQIPVIDLAPLITGENVNAVGTALRNASQNPGFIYVRNHGIPASVIAGARHSASQFFRLPQPVKRQITVSPHHRGWLDSGAAQMADDVLPDLKESFIWGNPADHGPQVHSLQGPNQWPDNNTDEFQQHATRWFECATQLAIKLLEGIAISFNLDSQFFLEHHSRPLSRASYVYYPQRKSARNPEQYGVGPHTDFGVLTILSQDQTGGLQIKNSQGQWIDAPPLAGTLIVNVGDVLTRWTHGEFRSAPHRVISPQESDRLSLVLAFDPNSETMIDARQVVPGLADYPDPISCGDYLDRRFSRAFAYRTETAP